MGAVGFRDVLSTGEDAAIRSWATSCAAQSASANSWSAPSGSWPEASTSGVSCGRSAVNTITGTAGTGADPRSCSKVASQSTASAPGSVRTVQLFVHRSLSCSQTVQEVLRQTVDEDQPGHLRRIGAGEEPDDRAAVGMPDENVRADFARRSEQTLEISGCVLRRGRLRHHGGPARTGPGSVVCADPRKRRDISEDGGRTLRLLRELAPRISAVGEPRDEHDGWPSRSPALQVDLSTVADVDRASTLHRWAGRGRTRDLTNGRLDAVAGIGRAPRDQDHDRTDHDPPKAPLPTTLHRRLQHE